MQKIATSKISIITCVYNGEKYISRLFDSVLEIDYPNIEHIVVNDGSTDSTEKIILRYCELYKNKLNSNMYIKYVKQENMGLGGATNTGLKNITGDFWTWINCDDWYEKEAFKEPIGLFDKHCDVVIMNRYLAYLSGGVFTKKIEIQGSNIKNYMHKVKRNKLIYKSIFVHPHFICKTASFDSINPTRTIDPFRYNQDKQLSATLFLNLNVKFDVNPRTNFFIRDDSFFQEGIKNNLDGFSTSMIKSFDYLSVAEKKIESEKNVFYINLSSKEFGELYRQANKLAFRKKYKSYYKKVLFRDKKYISWQIRFLYYSSFIPFLWDIKKKYRKV